MLMVRIILYDTINLVYIYVLNKYPSSIPLLVRCFANSPIHSISYYALRETGWWKTGKVQTDYE